MNENVNFKLAPFFVDQVTIKKWTSLPPKRYCILIIHIDIMLAIVTILFLYINSHCHMELKNTSVTHFIPELHTICIFYNINV